MDDDVGVFAFDSDTAATRTADSAYEVHVSDGWNIGTNPNGGYVLSLLTSALAQEAGDGHPDLLTITAHYLRPTTPGEPAQVHVEQVRQGRRHTHLQATLAQGTERVRALAAYGNLAEADGPTLIRTEPPEIPDPDDCAARHGGSDPVSAVSSFMHRFDTRLSPETGWLRGERTGVPRVVGWTRFADGREPDVASLPLFADALPPAVFELGPAGWVPTIELTVHVRGRPAPGWLLARFETRALVDGYLEEDGEIWDSEGRLVAQSRQLALLLPAG